MCWMRRRFGSEVVLGICLGLVAAAAAGCASSSKQTESASEATASETSADETTSQEASSENSGAERDSETSDEPERKPVTLESVLGTDTSAGLPDGCPNDWSELEGRDYDGTMYACEGFRVPERFRQPTVMIGIKEQTVRRVTLQAFYEGGDPIKQMYADVTDRYEKKCDADGASGSAMSFVCDDYVAQVAHRKRTGSLRIILGIENWDMPN